MRIVFMGTPDFAVPILSRLVTSHEVVAVLCAPDSHAGRGRRLQRPPVKEYAESKGIHVLQPSTLRDDAISDQLRSLSPDAICVAAYGLLLPHEILAIPCFGCINVHASLLPRHRGAAPIHRAILDGDARTGVSIMLMEESLDTGPVALIREIAVGSHTVQELSQDLAHIGAELLIEVLSGIQQGSIEWVHQDPAFATYAEKVCRQDVALSPGLTVETALRRVRASTPSAPSRAVVCDVRMTILEAKAADCSPGAGRASVGKKDIVLGLADGGIELVRVKPENRREMSADAFVCGHQGSDHDTWTVC